jgi:hypothetical protein
MYSCAGVELSAAILCQHEIPEWDTERVIKVDTAALSFRYCSQKASVPEESPSWSFLRPTLAATAAATYRRKCKWMVHKSLAGPVVAFVDRCCAGDENFPLITN